MFLAKLYTPRYYRFIPTYIFVSSLIFICACKQSKSEDDVQKFTNELANETSPYLLQHANNPVNWKPWSQKALGTAQKSDKLILVSIGYSSCHWCHVMEEETFSNEEVAKLMNENFINIKVDREERPDVDQIYMTAAQLINGSGGWPLNAITLPNGKPLYVGTYHTKEQWSKVLSKINKLYQDNPEGARDYANNLTQGIQEVNQIYDDREGKSLSKNYLTEIITKSELSWDKKWGGNIGSQKFMLPVNIDFLLNYGIIAKDTTALNQAKLTLDNVALKGVYDQLDGGFFRYSVDEKWQLPHFEKMLYDNAQLINTYSKAYKITKNPLYKKVVIESISFLNNNLRSKSGAYFASLDAGKDEGAYYLWTEKELNSLIDEKFELFKSYYNVKKENRVEDNKYHLFKSQVDSIFIKENNISEQKFLKLKNTWQETLLNYRRKRESPRIDDKIIVSWNALVVSGLSEAYTAFGNEEYLNMAVKTYDEIMANAFENGVLIHSYKETSKPVDGFLEDYAFLQQASLKLYAVTMEDNYLEISEKLKKTVLEKFSNNKNALYTYNSNDDLISKIVKTNDGVVPSANAVMAENFFINGHLNYDNEDLEKSKAMLTALVPEMRESPSAYNKWNSLLLKNVSPFYEIAVVGKDAKERLIELKRNYIPNALIVGSRASSDKSLFKNRYVEDETFIYVCKEKTCKLPVQDAEAALIQLESF